MMQLDEQFIQQVKTKYVWKWVAVKNGRVLAAGAFHEDLYRKLAAKELDGAYIFYCPTEEQKKYGFLFRL